MPYPISAVHSRRFVAAYADRMRMLFGANLIGYWPLWEASGATANDISPQANNGTYSNVTLAQAGIGDVRTSGLFVPASESLVNVYSAGLAADFSTTAGTIAIWVKVSGAGVWTDTITRMIYQLHTVNEIDVYAGFIKIDIGGIAKIYCSFRLNNVWKDVVFVTTTTGWFHVASTWDTVADQVKVYFNGAQTGATQTTLGSHAGPITAASIGNHINTGGPWDGNLAHAILLTRAATAPEIAEMARASV